MPRVDKKTKYAVCWLKHIGHHPTEISKELEITLKQVENILEKSINTNEKNIPTGSEPAVQKQTMKNLMINKTSSKKENSVSIMTPEASQMSDSLKSKTYPRKIHEAIYRPNDK